MSVPAHGAATLSGPEARASGDRRAAATGASGRLGAAPLLAAVAAIGLLLVALGNDGARTGAATAEPLFWAGLVAIYAPIAFRLLSAGASRPERIALVGLLAVSLFLVKLLYSPTQFVFYDELAWWRATHDLLQSGHPFSANPLVITTRGFPALDLLAGPLDALGRLSIFNAGTIVAGVARTAFLLALFLFFERTTGSSRAAGIGVLVYAANPSFMYFNAQFAYETLALMVALVLLLVVLRWTENREPLRSGSALSLVLAMGLLAATLTLTHHMTSYAILALLIGWVLLLAVEGPAPGKEMPPLLRTAALPALMLAVTASAWFATVAGGLTVTEVGDQVTGAVRSALHLVFGGSGPKKPFEAGTQTNAPAARAIAVISVLALLAAIPLGLRKIWRPSAKAPLQRVLAVLAVLYVATLGLRLTQSGTEASQRASEFVFIGLGFLTATLLVAMRGALARRSTALLIGGLATIVFLGGFVIGEPPQGRQPGAPLVLAERRSVTAEGLATADFAAQQLKPGSRILVDHANAMLLGSYGGLDPVTRRVDGIPISRVFFDRHFDRPARRVVLDGNIRYIVIDTRLASARPVQGYYFTLEEPLAYERKRPIALADLTKFAHVKGLNKVYANGPISIYDTYGLRSG